MIVPVCTMWGDVHDVTDCARCGGMHTMVPTMCTMWGDVHESGVIMMMLMFIYVIMHI